MKVVKMKLVTVMAPDVAGRVIVVNVETVYVKGSRETMIVEIT